MEKNRVEVYIIYNQDPKFAESFQIDEENMNA